MLAIILQNRCKTLLCLRLFIYLKIDPQLLSSLHLFDSGAEQQSAFRQFQERTLFRAKFKPLITVNPERMEEMSATSIVSNLGWSIHTPLLEVAYKPRHHAVRHFNNSNIKRKTCLYRSYFLFTIPFLFSALVSCHWFIHWKGEDIIGFSSIIAYFLTSLDGGALLPWTTPLHLVKMFPWCCCGGSSGI